MSAPHLSARYAQLPAPLHAPAQAAAFPDLRLIALDRPLAERLGLDADWLATPEGIAWLGGRHPSYQGQTIAQAYAGHQFGGYSPRLGDGRALLLGEIEAPDGGIFDLALKGSGPTVFSRRGDGFAALGPVLREYLVSRFMAATGVPTTRVLAALTTGAPVYRDTALPGAMLLRVAQSHLRVGTFEYAARLNDRAAIEALVAHAVARHSPALSALSPRDQALGLLRDTVSRQAKLVAQWMGLGFVHGVMNTDNMSISGETIDYGPCAFLDHFQSDAVFSSIDHQGRYRWENQPQIAVWNLAQLASALLPLIGTTAQDRDEATRVLHEFGPLYHDAADRVFAAKIGLAQSDLAADLVARLMDALERGRADFTQAFMSLTHDAAPTELAESDEFAQWLRDWRAAGPDHAAMARVNPLRHPRNHRIEAALEAASHGDFAPFHRLEDALANPFEARPEWDTLTTPPAPQERVTRTFCGT